MNALVTLNISDFMPSAARRSFIKAADRWHARYIEITTPSYPPVYPFWEKARVPFSVRPFGSFERVLQLDADTLVSEDCPNPFDIVPCSKFGVVSRVQPNRHNLAIKDTITVERFARRYRVKPYSKPRQHLNAGLLLYNQQAHDEILRRWQAKAERGTKRPKCPLPEQFVLSCILAETPQLVHWLPWQFNACRQSNGRVPQDCFIAHFHAPRQRPLVEIMRNFKFKRG